MADTDNQQGKRFPLFPKLIATSFGFGFLPVAPGTWGAVFAVLIWLPLYMLASPGAILAGTAAGALFCGGRYMGKLGGRALLGQGPCYSVCRRNRGAAHSDAAAVLRPRRVLVGDIDFAGAFPLLRYLQAFGHKES